MKNQFEALTSPEKPPLYEKTVFGHWFHEFDRDQFLTYYLAVRGGVISASSGFEFTPKVKERDLKDPTVFVVEGVPDAYEGVNSKDTGNFDNNPLTDAPAVAEFAQQCRDEFPDNFSPYATDIARWARSAETGKKMKKPLQLLQKADLDLATTKVFYGLKLRFADGKDAFLSAAVQMMDTVLNPSRTSSVAELYKEEIRLAQQAEAEARNRLMEKATQPEAIRAITTDTGVGLVMFDVRGTDTDSGAPGIAQAHAEASGVVPHLIMIVGDAKDDAGNILGNRLLLKIPKSQTESEEVEGVDLRTLLADRLHHLEALFGKGFVTEFGGHAGVIGSDREKGSGLEPRELWSALQNFFDKPRYAEAEFEAKALEFAREKLGVETVLPRATQTPGNAYELPERVMELGLPVEDNGEKCIISISESDLPLYEEYFEEVLDGNVTTFQSIMKEKTTLSEPSLIADYRALKAGGRLRELVQQPEKVEKTLDALNDLNPSQIEALPAEILNDILTGVANNETAIDLIWNKDNLRYRINENQVPDWMKADVEKYKAGRYTYLSLPYKIDEYLVKAITSQVLKSGDLSQIEQSAETLINILGSESYKSSHQGPVYDQLLHSTFRLCTSSELLEQSGGPELADKLLARLVENYGQDMKNHWELAKDQYKSLFIGARERLPALSGIYEELGISIEPDANPDYQLELWSPTEVVPPNPEIIKTSIEKQKASGRAPMVTVFVQVGRDIEELLKREGVFREGEDAPEKDLDMAGSIKINGYLRLGRDFDEASQLGELLYKYVEDVTEMVKTSGENANIRIMTGGFPGVLSRKVTAIFHEKMIQAVKAGDFEKAQELASISESLTFSDFNLQDKKFYDSSFVGVSGRE